MGPRGLNLINLLLGVHQNVAFPVPAPARGV